MDLFALLVATALASFFLLSGLDLALKAGRAVRLFLSGPVLMPSNTATHFHPTKKFRVLNTEFPFFANLTARDGVWSVAEVANGVVRSTALFDDKDDAREHLTSLGYLPLEE